MGEKEDKEAMEEAMEEAIEELRLRRRERKGEIKGYRDTPGYNETNNQLQTLLQQHKGILTLTDTLI